MLLAINDRIKGWLGAVIIGIIALPFALWGIQSYLGGGEEPYAAKVGEVEISMQELDYSVTARKQQLREQFGNELPVQDDFIKQQVLELLINRKVIEQASIDQGYRVSDAVLADNIKQLFSTDGQFDRDVFETLLRTRGQTIPQFEATLRDEIRVEQMINALRAGALVTTSEAERIARLEAQQREVSLLKYAVLQQADDIAVTDDEAQQYYAVNLPQFMTQAQVAVDYVELTGASLTDEFTPDEDRISQLYADYQSSLALREQRKARHILLNTPTDHAAAVATLEKIKHDIAVGQSFAELAKKHSEDTASAANGGDLGWVEHGQMVEPFEQALFALSEPGAVSDVVETQFGLHLIQLNEVKSEPIKPLAEKRAELTAVLKQEAVANLFYDLSETMATTAYENPDSLDKTAEALGLPLLKTELMTRNNGKGIAANEKIRQAAFSEAVFDKGVNSDVIELEPEHIVVLRVREHIAASSVAFEDVRDKIKTRLVLDKARDNTLALADAAAQKIRTGTNPASLAGSGVSYTQPVMVKRRDSTLEPSLLAMAYRMSAPITGAVTVETSDLSGGEVVLVILHKVDNLQSVDAGEVATLKRKLIQESANAEFEASLAALREGFDIIKNPRALE
jgi:peptidyl-prolyl cis-trans isomerase D